MKKCLLILVLLCLSTTASWAVSIPVLNASFENPNISPDEARIITSTGVPDWFTYVSSGELMVRGHGLSGWGVTDPADGDQFLGLTQSEIYQTTSATYQSGWTYTLTGAMARGEGTGAVEGRLRIGYINNLGQRAQLAQTEPAVSLADLPLGQWVDFSISVTIDPGWTSAIGSPVYIGLRGGNAWMYFDNIRLTATGPGQGPGWLTGTIELQAYGGDAALAPVKIELIQNNQVVRTEEARSSDNPQTYTITNVEAGTYDVAFTACKWLRYIARGVVVPAEDAGTANAVLINGDVDGDNVLSIGDAGITLWNENMEGDW